MIYLRNFELLNEDRHFKSMCKIFQCQTPDEYYPFGIFNPNFTGQKLNQVDFEDITIFYGGNGSGKTTLLNIISEKLNAFRYKEYTKTEAFNFYLDGCEFDLYRNVLPPNSKFLASDDVFDHILSVRKDNDRTKELKKEKQIYSVEARFNPRAIYPDKIQIDVNNPDEIEKFREFVEARKKTRRQFVRSRAGEMQRQYSNGENALMFFDKQIEENAIYFLDEPENSMSPKFQAELRTLIEDSVRYKNCQFVIATHSPFILSLFGAKIYNLDAEPLITVERWHELEYIRFYYDFFKTNEYLFEE